MPDAPTFIIAAIVVLLFASWAGWTFGGWRRHTAKPTILPDRVWLCDACRSFNDPTHLTCYRCHRPRAVDAREIAPDPEFKVDQQLGRAKSSLDWGASGPWLAADEPLRDAWLAERARTEEATAAGEAAEAGAAGEAAEDPGDPPEKPHPPR